MGYFFILPGHHGPADPASAGKPGSDELAQAFQAGWTTILTNRYPGGSTKKRLGFITLEIIPAIFYGVPTIFEPATLSLARRSDG
jgi:hypothetical protein